MVDKSALLDAFFEEDDFAKSLKIKELLDVCDSSPTWRDDLKIFLARSDVEEVIGPIGLNALSIVVGHIHDLEESERLFAEYVARYPPPIYVEDGVVEQNKRKKVACTATILHKTKKPKKKEVPMRGCLTRSMTRKEDVGPELSSELVRESEDNNSAQPSSSILSMLKNESS